MDSGFKKPKKQGASSLSRRTFIVGGSALMLPLFSACTSPLNTTPSSSDQESSIDQDIQQISTFAFDTMVSLAVYGDKTVLDQAVEACARYDKLFSAQREDSDIGRINRANGTPVTVDNDTAELIKEALIWCESSRGVFDITIGAVSLLWDFKNALKPSDEEISAALPHVDWRNVLVEGNTVTLTDPQAALDLGGIAKGWIADRLADLFRRNGIRSGLINLGGNVCALGEKPSGKPWTIGLRDPNVSAGRAVASVEVRDASVVTSGLYERHFEQEGINYHHILDPKTGYPAITDVRADTIVSDRSIDGDGLSTTLFIYGSERGMQEVESRGNIEALFTLEDNSTVASTGFDALHYKKLDV